MIALYTENRYFPNNQTDFVRNFGITGIYTRIRFDWRIIQPDKIKFGFNHQEKIMSWATHYISQLKEGKKVTFRPRGHSMKGKISSGQLVTVEPINNQSLKPGDIVLCKVNGSQYLHLIKAIQGNRYQIGNNIGRINGWITIASIYGICVKIED